MIIAGIDQLKRHVSIYKHYSYVSMQPHIEEAEANKLLPIIGRVLFEALENAIITNAFTPELDALRPYAEKVSANWAMWYAYPIQNVSFSEMGVQENVAKEGTSIPTQAWRYNEALKSYFNRANKAVESLYEFLQENKNNYPDWEFSDSFSVYNSLFIRNNKELSLYLDIGNSVQTFLSLRPYVRQAEQIDVIPMLTQAFTDDIKEYVASGSTANPYYNTLLPFIRSAVAWAGLSKAIPFLQFSIASGNIAVVQPEQIEIKNFALSKDQLSHFIRSAEGNKDQYLTALKKYLDENATNYPLYPAPADGSTSVTPYLNLPDNSGSTSFMV